MLVTGKSVLDLANRANYAVGAFNVNNMEIVQAVISAAEKEKAPVIIQTSESAIKYAGADYLANMIIPAAKKSNVPIVLHVDHGTTYDTIVNCIKSGWTSVMIDASSYDLEENIEKTKEIVKIAHACCVSVEAEIGRLSGVEDNISVDVKDSIYTNPKEALMFVNETKVDSLAVAIGTAHGKYNGVPKLDFDRLREIKELLKMPIVLHGASGLLEDALKNAVRYGVNKINIDTDLRQAFSDGCRETLVNKDEFDPRKVCGKARDKVEEVVRNKIKIFGSNEKF